MSEENQETETTAASKALPSSSGSAPPPCKEGWQHSKQVLVRYAANECHSETYSIAYYHYAPPFEDSPKWVDFSGNQHNRVPAEWWSLPLQNAERSHDDRA